MHVLIFLKEHLLQISYFHHCFILNLQQLLCHLGKKTER